MERIVEVPAFSFDYSLLLIEDDPKKQDVLLREADRQEKALKDILVKIVTSEGFAAFSFIQTGEYPMTLILHPSTRPGIDWQLSRFDCEGVPIGHEDYLNLEPLYKELLEYARCGACVRVLYEN